MRAGHRTAASSADGAVARPAQRKGQGFDFRPRRFAGRRLRDDGGMENTAGLPELRQTPPAERIDRRGVGLCGKQYDRLAEPLVRAACDGETACKERFQTAFHFLCLDFDAAGIDHIVLPPEDAEAADRRSIRRTGKVQFGSVAGHQRTGADRRGIDDEAAVLVEPYLHALERPVPVVGTGPFSRRRAMCESVSVIP